MKTKIQYRWLTLCIVLFCACQKEVSEINQETENTPLTTSGVVPDDPLRVANIQLVKSSNFSLETSVSNDGRFQPGTSAKGSKKDSDGDGIVDSKDSCKSEQETVNGYLDLDGCPD